LAALPDPLSSQAPLPAAPGIPGFPQFNECPGPKGSGATKAWKGFIRPYSDDETARQALRAFEANRPVQVDEGRIYVDANDLPKHPFEPYLIDMAVPCVVLILQFSSTAHPIAYLIDPFIVPRLSQCPHIRMDKLARIDGRIQPALCVYSGNLFKFASDGSRLEQFLDQTSTYLAKHLIWLRTRMLFRELGGGMREFVYRRRPDEPITNLDLNLFPDVYWDGYWPGLSAPSGPSQHLATIRREDECWCWSGKRYGDCCRRVDLARSRN
jgi:hypothetical protein